MVGWINYSSFQKLKVEALVMKLKKIYRQLEVMVHYHYENNNSIGTSQAKGVFKVLWYSRVEQT